MWEIRKLPNPNHQSQPLRNIPRPARQAHLQVHARCPQILLIDTLTFQRKLTKVTENQQVTRSPMIHFSVTTLLCRKPAQNLELDAKRVRLDAGKRAVLMLSHDVSFGSECCKPVTTFKSCEDSGEGAHGLLTGRATTK